MQSRYKRPISSLAVILLALLPAIAAAQSPGHLAAAADSINAEELYHHVEVLADDVYEGRAAGSRGGRAAARYLVQQLRHYDLTPAGDNGDYIQQFNNGWQNILVVQPGYDPNLRHEFIVLGAHYDHVGYGSPENSNGPIGHVHNGADDNASGVAALLETIEAFATTGLATRRSILFAFWDGEEQGLVGSRHWLAQPPATAPDATHIVWPHPDSVKLAINADMVGRLREGRLYVLGSRSGYGLRRLFSGPLPEMSGSDDLWLDFSWQIGEDSDHWSFLERRIPSVLLHTGLHDDYHRPTDVATKVKRDGLRDVARYLLAVLAKVANEDELPPFRSQVTRESERLRRALEQPPQVSLTTRTSNGPPPRLGISWRDDEAEPGAVLLIRVTAGTPAAAAGLAPLDRIYALDGRTFTDAAEFHSTIHALLDAHPTHVTLLIERRGHTRTITVNMPSTTPEQPVELQAPHPAGS